MYLPVEQVTRGDATGGVHTAPRLKATKPQTTPHTPYTSPSKLPTSLTLLLDVCTHLAVFLYDTQFKSRLARHGSTSLLIDEGTPTPHQCSIHRVPWEHLFGAEQAQPCAERPIDCYLSSCAAVCISVLSHLRKQRSFPCCQRCKQPLPHISRKTCWSFVGLFALKPYSS